MKILVVGTGAIGSCYGGALYKDGNDVIFLARGNNLKVINSRGLSIKSAKLGDFNIMPKVTDSLKGDWKADLILYCVKSFHNDNAVPLLAPAINSDTRILTLQNGLGSGDLLANKYGNHKLLLGAAYIDAKLKEHGVAEELGGPFKIVFGQEDNLKSDKTLEIENVLKSAGIEADLSEDILLALWSKLALICALSGMSCITRGSAYEILTNAKTLELSWRVMREVGDVARGKGVSLTEDKINSIMDQFKKNMHASSSSMYLDLISGNRLEVNVLNGIVVEYGKELGIPTPINEFITYCLSIQDNRAKSNNSNS